jgi:putative NADH-flavin reductase
MTQRILLLWASGRTGSLALECALSLGLEAVALARRPAAITLKSDNQTLIEGSPLNAIDLGKRS